MDKKRQEEADKIIQHVADGLTVKPQAQIYAAKYLLQPKDELYSKYKEFHSYIISYMESSDEFKGENAFKEFKERFSDELSGTAGLDELERLIRSHSFQPSTILVLDWIKELKDRREK